MERRILVVEDQWAERRLFKQVLTSAGYRVSEAENGQKALAAIRDAAPDLVLLDLNLPDTEGFELCEKIRTLTEGHTLILVITGFPEPDLDIKCLRHGATGYLNKPVGKARLLAYVEALLRLTPPKIPTAPLIRCGVLEIDPGTREVFVDRNKVPALSAKEFNLLAFLAANQEQVVKKEIIALEVWGRKKAARSRTIDAHIKTLRQKLGAWGPRIIQTTPGTGYRAVVISSQDKPNRSDEPGEASDMSN